MRLALGTVQFGLDYGVSNRAGEVPDDVLAVDLEALAQLCDSLGRSVPGVIWSKA